MVAKPGFFQPAPPAPTFDVLYPMLKETDVNWLDQIESAKQSKGPFAEAPLVTTVAEAREAILDKREQLESRQSLSRRNSIG